MAEFTPNVSYCSFCGRSQDKVRKLIGGGTHPSRPNVFICDECIQACNEVLMRHLDHGFSTEFNSLENLPKPSEIKNILDEYVIGQETAKRILSVA